jgi:hypothetical protein
MASHLRSALICSGPSRSQMACTAAGSAQVANPLSSAVWAIPALVAWRMAHSCPLRLDFVGLSKLGTRCGRWDSSCRQNASQLQQQRSALFTSPVAD